MIELSEKSNAHIVKSILDYLSKYVDNNLVFWTGMLHVIDLLTKLKESGDKEGIKIDNIVVFLPPSYHSLSDYEQRKLKLLNEVISILRK